MSESDVRWWVTIVAAAHSTAPPTRLRRTCRRGSRAASEVRARTQRNHAIVTDS